ncbi:GyrI-like domain-containing protein [Silvibacterium dinghuense]|nr:GyrI-like domain-containing protein [Silvibacterium dinghuense]GGH08080.1 hypothetical protein GCM10011586_25450 [Silvibacterium dinghuense]
MNLTPEFEAVSRPATHFVFLEARGPFAETAAPLWKALPPLLPGIEPPAILEFLGLSGMDKEKSGDEAMIYQAGVSLTMEPTGLPGAMKYRLVPAGRYARFVLTGSYTQIGQAFDFAFKTLGEKQTALRPEFCVENYLNDPRTTPEAELKTELLIPIA